MLSDSCMPDRWSFSIMTRNSRAGLQTDKSRFESCYAKSNLDCNYSFSIDLVKTDRKSVVIILSLFNLTRF